MLIFSSLITFFSLDVLSHRYELTSDLIALIASKLFTMIKYLSFYLLVLFPTLLLQAVLATQEIKCPGSPAWKHAKCSMTVTFPSTTCTILHEEITSRLSGENSWIDPHNGGTYTSSSDVLDEATGVRTLEGSRLTGDGKYTDKFTLVLSSDDEVSSSCTMTACSESQCTSVLDFSTNYCNIRSLYCNSEDGCPIVKWNLQYEETFKDCWQNDAEKCVVSPVAQA